MYKCSLGEGGETGSGGGTESRAAGVTAVLDTERCSIKAGV